MSTQFESPRFLVKQTKDNISEFEHLANAAIQAGRSSTVIDVDPKTRNKTYKFVFGWSLPDKARHIAATGISDLRHALDQSLCASVSCLNPEADIDTLYFPFATNAKDLAGRLKSPKSVIPGELHHFIEGLQPYPTQPGGGGNDILCRLSKSAGPNKHKASCTIAGRITSFDARNFNVNKAVGPVLIPPAWNTSKNEMVLATVAPDGHVDADFDVTYYVAFGDAGQLTGKPVAAVLSNLVRVVDRIVDGFEAETARLMGR